MDIRRLREIIKQHGTPGILYVAGYLWARGVWHCQRGLCLACGTTFLLLAGGITWRLLLPHAPPKAIPLFVPASKSATSLIDTDKRDRSLKWAEAMLAKWSDCPPILGKYSADGCRLWEVKKAFQAIQSKYGESSRGYSDLAECEMRIGKYEAAEQDWQRALELSLSYPQAVKGLAKWRSLFNAKRIIDQRIPVGQVVTCIRKFVPRSGETFWAVLHGKADPAQEDWCECRQMHFTLFTDVPHCQQVGESLPLIDERFADIPADQDDGFRGVELYTFDMTGEGSPQLIVHEMSFGGSWAPAQMEAFAWRAGRLVRILRMKTNQGLFLQDINHDGRFEVRNFYEVGGTMCHAEQPRWSDIYAYDGQRYAIANHEFPAQFSASRRELKETLQHYPKDEEIQAYLCLADSLLGRRREAGLLRKRATAYFQQSLEGERLQSHLADIRR